MLKRLAVVTLTLNLLLAIGCADEPGDPRAPPMSATSAPAATATRNRDDLAAMVNDFVAAVDRQEAILKRYSKDGTTLQAGDGEALWKASLEGEQALSQIADLAKAHPEWKARIVQWWHAEIEPAHVRHFRAGRHTLKTELLKQAAPDTEQLRTMLMRELSAGVALDRLAKEVKAGV